MDLLDILLDEDNTQPIALLGSDGKLINFEQIAVIPFKDTIYCLLKPIDEIEGIGDDEVIVFGVKDDGNSYHLEIENNEEIALEVYNAYLDLIEEEMKKHEGEEDDGEESEEGEESDSAENEESEEGEEVDSADDKPSNDNSDNSDDNPDGDEGQGE